MMSPAPPAWVDGWLRSVLPARDRDTVSGDLMEEYREKIRPQRSRLAADAWYVAQVSRFAWRIGLWALVLAGGYVGRTALDWFVPTTNFAPRSEATTLTTLSLLLVIGASSTLRTQSVRAAVVSTATALTLAAVLSAIVNAIVYWSWRSPDLLATIDSSGGMTEAFTLPAALIVPGTLVGGIGALIASKRSRLHRLNSE